MHFVQSSQPTAVLDLRHRIEANGTNSTSNAAIFVGVDYSPCVLWNMIWNRTTTLIMGIMEQEQQWKSKKWAMSFYQPDHAQPCPNIWVHNSYETLQICQLRPFKPINQAKVYGQTNCHFHMISVSL